MDNQINTYYAFEDRDIIVAQDDKDVVSIFFIRQGKLLRRTFSYGSRREVQEEV